MTTSRETREHEIVGQLCAASIRALTGCSDLYFRGGELHRGETWVHAPAPHLRPVAGLDDFGSFRGVADGLALRLLHSDPVEHARLRPDDQVGRWVFELLEQFRVEALAARSQAGTISNLRHRHEAWSIQFHDSGLTETASGLLLYAVAQVGRSKVTGERVVEATEDMLEATRFGLAPLIGADLALLRRLRYDQSSYALPARRIAEKVAELAESEARSGRAPRGRARATPNFSLALNDRDIGEGVGEAASRAGGRTDGLASQHYRVFTEAWDREWRMSRLSRPEQLREYRARLDDLVEDAGFNLTTVARRLRELAPPRKSGWDTAQEEGLVDSGRLSRLVSSPTDARIFRSPQFEASSEVQVSFLLDCSGSMRPHQEKTATLVDGITRALDLAGIRSEVLAFTTGAWNGGRAERDWRRAGRPARPGRLNERLHLVLKDADRSWRTARPEIAGLLRPDFYREALDGEAVEWSVARLASAADLVHRQLVVVTDGSPMDGATNLVNDPGYLDRHLMEVLARTRAAGEVAVVGLGIGLDLSHHYRDGHVLDFAGPVDQAMLREVADLLISSVTAWRSW